MKTTRAERATVEAERAFGGCRRCRCHCSLSRAAALQNRSASIALRHRVRKLLHTAQVERSPIYAVQTEVVVRPTRPAVVCPATNTHSSCGERNTSFCVLQTRSALRTTDKTCLGAAGRLAAQSLCSVFAFCEPASHVHSGGFLLIDALRMLTQGRHSCSAPVTLVNGIANTSEPCVTFAVFGYPTILKPSPRLHCCSTRVLTRVHSVTPVRRTPVPGLSLSRWWVFVPGTHVPVRRFSNLV